MHNIIYVEKMEINNKGDLEVTAILENEGKRQGMTYIDQAPEVAPIRAKTTIFKEAFPARTILQNTDPEEMVRLIEDYKLFLHQEWKPVRSEVESNEGDKPQQGGRLFF